jgi:hypothetical protein
VKLALTVAMLLIALRVEQRSAQALPVCQFDRDYYSDNTFSTEIGQWQYTCSGAPSRWGTTSLYWTGTEYGWECNGQCQSFEFQCNDNVMTCYGGPCPSEPCTYFE